MPQPMQMRILVRTPTALSADFPLNADESAQKAGTLATSRYRAVDHNHLLQPVEAERLHELGKKLNQGGYLLRCYHRRRVSVTV